MLRVIIESPYGADSEHVLARNIAYAKAAMRDSLARGEAPLASHLLYTQADILDDRDPAQRAQGIEAGLTWAESADVTVVYTDLGLTAGMNHGINDASSAGRRIIYRSIPGWS